MSEKNNFENVDFEIAKKQLGLKINRLVAKFIDATGVDGVNVSIFTNNADVTLLDDGNPYYGKTIQCMIDTNEIEDEEDDDE